MTQESAGYTQDALNLTNFGGTGTGCRYAYTGKSSMSVCTDAAQTWVNISRNSGRATYYTSNWARIQTTNYYTTQHCHYSSWWGCSYHTHYNYYYTYNNVQLDYTNYWQWWGYDFQAMGSNYAFDVLLEDAAGHTFKSDPVVVPLTNYNSVSYFSYGYQQWWGKNGNVIY